MVVAAAPPLGPLPAIFPPDLEGGTAFDSADVRGLDCARVRTDISRAVADLFISMMLPGGSARARQWATIPMGFWA